MNQEKIDKEIEIIYTVLKGQSDVINNTLNLITSLNKKLHLLELKIETLSLLVRGHEIKLDSKGDK